MRERRGRGRVGQVVGRHVDGLDRGDRALLRGGDALLKLAHLGGQRRLVAHGARHTTEQSGHLRTGLREAEDVVDEEEDVLAVDVAEVLRHRQAGQSNAEAGSRRLVHLAVDEGGLGDDARLLHLEPEVVALAGALADAGEDGQAAVLRRDVIDELLDEHGLADASATEEADFAALRVRGEQVDDLDAGLEQRRLRIEILELRGLAVDAPALAGNGLAVIDGIAEHVEDASERLRTNRNADRGARVDDLGTASQTVRGVHGDRADAVVAEVLLDLRHDEAGGGLNVKCRVDRGKRVREDGVDDDTLNLHDLADVALAHVRLVPSQVDGLEGDTARPQQSARASGGTLANVAAGRGRNRPQTTSAMTRKGTLSASVPSPVTCVTRPSARRARPRRTVPSSTISTPTTPQPAAIACDVGLPAAEKATDSTVATSTSTSRSAARRTAAARQPVRFTAAVGTRRPSRDRPARARAADHAGSTRPAQRDSADGIGSQKAG